MKLFIDTITNIKDLKIDFITVKTRYGDIYDLTCDESEISREPEKNKHIETWTGVSFDYDEENDEEVYGDGNELIGMSIEGIEIHTYELFKDMDERYVIIKNIQIEDGDDCIDFNDINFVHYENRYTMLNCSLDNVYITLGDKFKRALNEMNHDLVFSDTIDIGGRRSVIGLIEILSDQNKIPFSKVDNGEYFRHGEDIYIKIRRAHFSGTNAVSVKDGAQYCLYDDQMVTRLNAELKIH